MKREATRASLFLLQRRLCYDDGVEKGRVGFGKPDPFAPPA
jgi:hypothetical protein